MDYVFASGKANSRRANHLAAISDRKKKLKWFRRVESVLLNKGEKIVDITKVAKG